MRTRTTSRAAHVAASIAALVALASGSAAAAPVSKDQCIDANALAQSLRRAGKLTGARQQLRICVSASCPRLVRDDCAQRLEEVDRAQPTVVFHVKDDEGRDLSAVRVTVDGAVVASTLDGSALPLDLGKHTVGFEAEGRRPLTREIVLHEGEKLRAERVVLEPLPAATPAATSAPPIEERPAPIERPDAARAEERPASASATSTPATSPSTSAGATTSPGATTRAGKTQRLVAVGVGGAGVVAVAFGAVMGAAASASWDDARSACPSATNCPDRAKAVDAHDAAVDKARWATVGFIGGGALLAGAVVLWLTAPRDARERPAPRAIALTPALGPGGGAITVGGAF